MMNSTSLAHLKAAPELKSEQSYDASPSGYERLSQESRKRSEDQDIVLDSFLVIALFFFTPLIGTALLVLLSGLPTGLSGESHQAAAISGVVLCLVSLPTTFLLGRKLSLKPLLVVIALLGTVFGAILGYC